MSNLDRSPVRLMHYDPSWRQEFAQTRSSLLYACEGWLAEIEHIGSTAIPGLIAQPTIDVIAAVSDEQDIDQAAFRIEGLNFKSSELDTSILLTKPRHLLEGQSEPTHRVFLTVLGSPLWKSTIMLRDYFLQSPEAAVQYEEVKMLNWKRFKGDREKYETGKLGYLTHVSDQLQAKKTAPPSGS